MLDPGVTLPNVLPTLILSTPFLMFELVACSVFEFGQTPKATSEVFNGGHTLERFMVVVALSEDVWEEFAWLEGKIYKFCSALDALSGLTSYKIMIAIMSSVAISARALSLQFLYIAREWVGGH